LAHLVSSTQTALNRLTHSPRAVLDYSVTSSARAQGWRDVEPVRLGSLEVDG
jgi:hypothetical protein